MKIKAAVLGAVLGSLPVMADSASAQTYRRDGMPPQEVVTMLRSTRLMPVGQPVRRGDAYEVRAVDPYGQTVRVIVDAQYGDIISVTPIGPARYAPPGYPRNERYPGAEYPPYELYPGDGLPPGMPPPVVPRPGVATLPPAATPARPPAGTPPARTVAPKKLPVPKERPATASSKSAPGDATKGPGGQLPAAAAKDPPSRVITFPQKSTPPAAAASPPALEGAQTPPPAPLE
jgi:hypothetical protein